MYHYPLWILMTQDRVGHDEFPLTEEFLTYMLGARRASVTIAGGFSPVPV
jgi:hypothetical protein